mmetsp:Transcript_21039/g.35289  ORF Transcript_21039/g.35289 Transcript_21039/m.35289 type:complete len:321 (-) Transcript_21039:484-1446(-)
MLHLPSAFLSIIMVMIMARPLLSTQANRIDSTRELIEVEEIIGRVKYRNCSILGSRPSCKSEDVPRFLKNRDIYDPKHKVIIGWTPKAGSTNTMQMAFRQMGIHYQGYWIHDFRTQIYQPCMGVMPKACYYSEAEWYSFKIVRNPFNRLVSSYFHSMKFNWVTLKHIQALIPSVTSKASVSFRIFVEYIHQATKKNVALDGHILQQVTDWEYNYFKSHDNQSIYDKIVKVEDFERDIAVVNNATGLSYSMSNLTSAHHHRGLRDRGHAPSSVMLRSTGGGGGDVRRVVRAMKASSSSTDSSSSSSSRRGIDTVILPRPMM